MQPIAQLASLAALSITISAGFAPSAQAQARSQDAPAIAHRNAIEKELESIAIIERKVMVPMRDGKRMQADVYRPKDQSKKYPIIFVRTPYNFNFWDVELGAPRDMSTELDAVKHGYAYVEMNERGRYFSEGDYDILGPPLTDSDDALDWMGALPWSADKVGLIGCSSTAEWQLAVASRGNRALATFIPESFGAGVGRVGPYYEQGNWFRGGAVQIHHVALRLRPSNQRRQAQLSARHVAGSSGHCRQILRSLRAPASSGLVQGPPAPAGERHPGRCRQRARHLRRYHPLRQTRHDRAHPQRSLLVPGRPVERPHAHRYSRPVAHDLV
jgi:predicted acyl esterase